MKNKIKKTKKKKDMLEKDASNIQLVVLMGDVVASLSPVSYTQPACLLSINSRPAIFNIITKLVKRGLEEILFVVNPFDKKIVQSFIEKTYPSVKVRFIVQKTPKGSLKAFQMCASYITKPVLLLYGTTTGEFDFDFTHSWVGIADKKETQYESNCLIDFNKKGEITNIIDYPKYPTKLTQRLAGIYFFHNLKVLKQSVSRIYSLTNENKSITNLLKYYNSKNNMKVKRIKNWSNSKNLKDYVYALRRNINGRSFNSFKVDDLGIITKRSKEKKLESEIKWFEEIFNTDISHISPQFLGRIQEKGTYGYKIEFLEYLSLAEYYTYYPIESSAWKFILESLVNTAKKLWYHHEVPKSYDIEKGAKEIYITKTLERNAKWERQDLLNLEEVVINDVTYKGFNYCWNKLFERIENLVKTSHKFKGIVHGDLCFGNILYAPKSSIFKFIDPRGYFGEMGIYGDIRYEMAKLRHNYHGYFDYITSDLFTVKENHDKSIDYKYYSDSRPSYLMLDDVLLSNGFDIDDIELIEGLLFISMIPLHADSKDRQLMFFATGIKCLNNQL